MKRTLAVFLALAIVGGASDTYYTRRGHIDRVADGVVYVTDTTGNVWTYYGDGQPGQAVKLLMDCQHTTDIYDDVVYKVLEV